MLDIREIANRSGPFASVCFDSSHVTEDAARQLELRWRSISAKLESAGATQRMLIELDNAIANHPPTPGRCGRLLIADEEQLLVDQRLPRPPVREVVRFSPLPYLLPLIELHADQLPHVVAMVDRVGSDVYAIDEHGFEIERTVDGTHHPVHKVRHGGGWSHRSMQRRVEETARRNLREVADEVSDLADAVGAEVVVLGGEVESRSALRAQVESTGHATVEVETGGRAPGTEPEALDAAVQEIVHQHLEQRRAAVLDRLTAELGRTDGLAVVGIAATTFALSNANVDRLVINGTVLGDRMVRVGADPYQLAGPALSDSEPDLRRADEALPVAAFAVGAEITLVDDELAPPDGVGALLRHH